MSEFIIPTSAELEAIAQDKLPRLTAQRPCFDWFPTQNADAAVLMWEQKDNYTGLQQIRGMNGEPPKITKVGVKRYLMEPGIYGEHSIIDELELTTRRQYGTFGSPVDISDLVMDAQDQLLQRRIDRIELIVWTLGITGTFSVSGPSGGVLATDSYSTQTFSASVAWSTVATSTPLADFRAVQLLGRGHSVNFGASAKAYMNRVTANNMLANTNNADLYGRRTAGLGTFNSMPQINTLLAGDDLPQVVVYDEGYLNDSGTFVPFIPNNKVLVVGQRPANQPVGNYRFTRNANNPNLAPGPYQKVIDHGTDRVPRLIEVHDGHNGGPVIYYPSAFVAMSV